VLFAEGDKPVKTVTTYPMVSTTNARNPADSCEIYRFRGSYLLARRCHHVPVCSAWQPPRSSFVEHVREVVPSAALETVSDTLGSRLEMTPISYVAALVDTVRRSSASRSPGSIAARACFEQPA
jgi:hypothetical protein